MKNKDEKSILNLSKAYQRAEESILNAVNSHKASNVKDYQKLVNKAVSDAVKMLADKNKKFVERELPKAFSEGQKEVQGHTPTVHTVMTAKDVSVILRQAGFRYSGKGLQYDTYIEVQKATENAGKGFLSRVNKKIKELEKNGEDTLYNVEQAVKDDLQKNGINVVEYKNGTKVSLDSYAKMAVRSARIESKNGGIICHYP